MLRTVRFGLVMLDLLTAASNTVVVFNQSPVTIYAMHTSTAGSGGSRPAR